MLTEADSTALFSRPVLAEREARVGDLPLGPREAADADPDWGRSDFTVLRLAASGGRLDVLTLSAPRGSTDERIRATFFDSFRLG